MSAKAEIDVTAVETKQGYAFDVVVREGRGETRHRVTLAEDDLRRFGGGKVGPAALVRESFRFLLDREPKCGVPFLPSQHHGPETVYISIP